MAISNLPSDVIEEILYKLPATSLGRSRFTCKLWNTLVKDPIFIKKHSNKAEAAERKSLFVVLMNQMIYSMSIDFNNGISITTVPYTKFPSKPNLIDSEKVSVVQVFQCDAIFLCTMADKSLVVWNPCTGQTMWLEPDDKDSPQLEPGKQNDSSDIYAMGYTNNNYKILRQFRDTNVIYEFCSKSWRVLDDDDKRHNCSIRSLGVSLKGHTYWVATQEANEFFVLLSFDFEKERFHCLNIPPRRYTYTHMTVSLVKEEELSLVHWNYLEEVTDVWVSKKIQTTTDVYWNRRFKLGLYDNPKYNHDARFYIDYDMKYFTGCLRDLGLKSDPGIGNEVEGDQLREVCLSDLIRFPFTLSYVPSLTRF